MASEPVIRLAVFLSVLIVVAVAESIAPRRVRVASRTKRTINNLLLVALNSLIVRAIPALSAVGTAAWAANTGWGLFNRVEMPGWLAGLISFVLLDLLIYGQHVMMHRIPLLWRVHRVHHADLDLDATSGLRFHPVEIMLSMLVKSAAVVILGAQPLVVMIFEIVLNASSIFNHGNLKLPFHCDRVLRWSIVTPDMHRVHHSFHTDETNSNFGFNFPWWDWLFGTYRCQPRHSHETMPLGLPGQRMEADTVPVAALLMLPFVRRSSLDSSGRDERPDADSRHADL